MYATQIMIECMLSTTSVSCSNSGLKLNGIFSSFKNLTKSGKGLFETTL